MGLSIFQSWQKHASYLEKIKQLYTDWITNSADNNHTEWFMLCADWSWSALVVWVDYTRSCNNKQVTGWKDCMVHAIFIPFIKVNGKKYAYSSQINSFKLSAC
jgi:hypothetical protein